MKIRKRMKRSTRQYITVAIICIIVIGGAAIITSFVITKQIRQEYENQLAVVNQEKADNQRSVYTAVYDIKIGDIITKDNIKKMTVYASQPQETYMTMEGIGRAAILDIPAGTHIMDSMLTGNVISSELREVEYDVIQMNSNIVTNDTVDVRIFYPNGEDFTVLSKKVIKSYRGESQGCFLWLNEEEILRMQSAVIDAYLYTGTYLYTTKYIEPILQNATIVNYEPSIEAINLILENPNIIETATNELSTLVRKALENRLSKSMNKDVTKKQWNLEDDFIYQQRTIQYEMNDPESDQNKEANLGLEDDMIINQSDDIINTVDAMYKSPDKDSDDEGLDKSLDKGLDKGLGKGLDKSLDKDLGKGIDKSPDKGSDKSLDKSPDRNQYESSNKYSEENQKNQAENVFIVPDESYFPELGKADGRIEKDVSSNVDNKVDVSVKMNAEYTNEMYIITEG